jgi:hypothetical protein
MGGGGGQTKEWKKGLCSIEQEADGINAEVVASRNGEQLVLLTTGYVWEDQRKTTKRIKLVVVNYRVTTDCLDNTRSLPQL